LNTVFSQIKAEVDDIIDRCKHLEHFRDAILEAKEVSLLGLRCAPAVALNCSRRLSCVQRHDKDGADTKSVDGKEVKAGSRKQFWKDAAVNALERYFYLIAFNAYLKVCSLSLSDWLLATSQPCLQEAVPAEFAVPFSKWVAGECFSWRCCVRQSRFIGFLQSILRTSVCWARGKPARWQSSTGRDAMSCGKPYFVQPCPDGSL
jgi:hypothetical protein